MVSGSKARHSGYLDSFPALAQLQNKCSIALWLSFHLYLVRSEGCPFPCFGGQIKSVPGTTLAFPILPTTATCSLWHREPQPKAEHNDLWAICAIKKACAQGLAAVVASSKCKSQDSLDAAWSRDGNAGLATHKGELTLHDLFSRTVLPHILANKSNKI